MHKAMFWTKEADRHIQCLLCPQNCYIREGKTGFCRVRKNIEGELYSLNFGQCSSYALDPIEKKPLYHFHPGSAIFSVGTFGCNLKCGFCQNWTIAHEDPETVYITPEDLVKTVQRAYLGLGQAPLGIAYTYSEPLMWFEYVYETAKLAREAGMVNVLVTNGYINKEPLGELLPLMDAMNIDVKGFTNHYYRESCTGRLDPVLKTVETASRRCHVEITTLLVPGLNDSADEVEQLTQWLAGIDPEIPIHFSRYFPSYKMSLPPTPVERMEQAREIALERLSYVYLGNMEGMGKNTYCPQCGVLLIQREGYGPKIMNLKNNQCAACGRKISLIK